MANNIFQVKRTSTAGRTPNTTGSYATNSQYIAAGEFALNMADQILYTSDGTKLIIVGATQSNATVNNHFVTSSLTVGNVFIGTNSAVNINATTVAVGNSTVNGSISTNSSVAYFTGTSYNALNANNALNLGGTAAASYALTSSLSAYQTTAGLSANVTTLTSNNTNFVGSVSAANVVSNAQLQANLSNYPTSFQLSSNLANYALLSGATFTGPITTTSITTPFVNHGNNSVNVVINSTSIAINGGVGSLNQVLTSNGTATIWQSVSASANAAAQYTWTNTQSFSNTITFSGNVVISNTITVNGSVGSAGQVLTSSATGNVYWSTVTSGSGSFTNGASIAVSNIAYTNTTGTSVGVAYQFINTISGSLDTVFS